MCRGQSISSEFHRYFFDLKINNDMVITKGDNVIVASTATGTNDGAMMGHGRNQEAV